MTDPTGSALMARIKELEDALRPFTEAEIKYYGMIDRYQLLMTEKQLDTALKALNK